MSLYRTVYDPSGTGFEVPPERASDLVLNHDWSNTPPKAAKKAKASATHKDETAAPTADTEATGPDADTAGPSESG